MLKLSATHEAFADADRLDTAIDRFWRRCRARNLSEGTIAFYGYHVTAFTRYLEAKELWPVSPSTISPDTLRGFLAERLKVSDTTASHSLVTLRALFGFMESEGMISENPTRKLERIRRKQQVIPTFTSAQIEAVLATCQGNTLEDLRDRAMLLLLIDCGLRASELCGLAEEGINWDDQTLRILGKGNKERLVPFGEVTRHVLRDYLARRGKLQGVNDIFISRFGAPLTRHRVLEIIRRRCEKAEITGVRCSPHTFRHTFAVMYLRNGGDVFSLQKLLGHTDLTMTRRYAELSQTDVIDKHRACSPGDKFGNAVKVSGKRKCLW